MSLKQPFAELILQGRKKIELRKWNTKFRGEFFIHASKSPDNEFMSKFGFKELPLGRIVGKAKIIKVKKYNSKEEFEKDRNLHLDNGSFEGYGFILEDVERVEEFFCKGALGFWEVKE